METVLVGLGIVLVIAVIFGAAVAAQKKTIANLRAIARRTGLQLHGADGSVLFTKPSVHGELDGRMVRFWAYATGAGKSRRQWVAVGVQPRRLGGLTFDFQPQGLLTSLSELFGAKEASTGDRSFDERWFLQTNEPELIGAVLLPEIRARLMAAYEAGARSHFRTESGWVCYTEQGNFADERVCARLETQLPLLRDLADLAEACAEGRG